MFSAVWREVWSLHSLCEAYCSITKHILIFWNETAKLTWEWRFESSWMWHCYWVISFWHLKDHSASVFMVELTQKSFACLKALKLSTTSSLWQSSVLHRNLVWTQNVAFSEGVAYPLLWFHHLIKLGKLLLNTLINIKHVLFDPVCW
jgi:hypothetical protein